LVEIKGRVPRKELEAGTHSRNGATWRWHFSLARWCSSAAAVTGGWSQLVHLEEKKKAEGAR
jgi:hypothetical protein